MDPFLIFVLLIVAVGAVRLFYWYAIYGKLAFHEVKDLQPSVLPLVSVIVVSKDHWEDLSRLIPKLLDQNYPNFEVIVMDDFSTDGTKAGLFEINHPRLRKLRASINQPGKKFALAEAIYEAKGEWILLTDADCEPADPNWINRMISAATPQTEIVLGYSPAKNPKNFISAFSAFETWHTAVQYLSFALSGIPYMGVGRNLMYRKSLFLKQVGFQSHIQIIGGDDDLFVNESANASNTSICIHPESWVWTSAKTELDKFAKQKSRHLSTAHAYQKIHQWMLGLIAAAHILWYGLPVCMLIFGLASFTQVVLAWIGLQVLLLPLLFTLGRKLGFGHIAVSFLAFDFLHFIYLKIMGARLLFASKNKASWN